MSEFFNIEITNMWKEENRENWKKKTGSIRDVCMKIYMIDTL